MVNLNQQSVSIVELVAIITVRAQSPYKKKKQHFDLIKILIRPKGIMPLDNLLLASLVFGKTVFINAFKVDINTSILQIISDFQELGINIVSLNEVGL